MSASERSLRLTKVFEAAQGQIAWPDAVEAEWETREPEVSGVRLELDQSAAAGSLRVRILSHTVGVTLT